MSFKNLKKVVFPAPDFPLHKTASPFSITKGEDRCKFGVSLNKFSIFNLSISLNLHFSL